MRFGSSMGLGSQRNNTSSVSSSRMKSNSRHDSDHRKKRLMKQECKRQKC